MNVFWGILESACLCVCPSVCPCVCVQNISFCQSAGGSIKSHLVTALIYTIETEALLLLLLGK